MKRFLIIFAIGLLLVAAPYASGQDVRRRYPLIAVSVPHDIVWTNITDATVGAGNTLGSNHTVGAFWTASASSSETLGSNVDGYVELTIGSSPDLHRIVGLGTTGTGGGNARVNFGIYIFQDTGQLAIWEGGFVTFGSNYTNGDVIRVERSGGNTIVYKKNGSTIYTSSTTNSGVLYANATIELNDVTLENVILSGSFS